MIFWVLFCKTSFENVSNTRIAMTIIEKFVVQFPGEWSVDGGRPRFRAEELSFLSFSFPLFTWIHAGFRWKKEWKKKRSCNFLWTWMKKKKRSYNLILIKSTNFSVLSNMNGFLREKNMKRETDRHLFSRKISFCLFCVWNRQEETTRMSTKGVGIFLQFSIWEKKWIASFFFS